MRTPLSKSKLNEVLFALLGSNDLVPRWWHSPNHYFDGKTPEEIYENEPQRVQDYIMQFIDR